ncbi:MAG: rod shape-determining protein RodA [Planctomycetaceae bacterium]|nr:rod shape-determining protein RodA [Planctomycetaceae bacterium]
MSHGRSINSPVLLLMTITVLLAVIGISGIARGDELAGGSAYAPKQLTWLLIGVVAAGVAYAIPYRFWASVSYPFYFTTILALVAVFAFPPRNGSRRWIPMGPISLQPSEFAKLAYILALAHYLMFRDNHRTWRGLLAPFAMTCVPVLLVLKEPDLGTSLLFFPVLFAMLYAAGARHRHFLLTAIAGIAFLPVLWSVMSAEQKSRVTAVFTQSDTGEAPTGDGYHLHQSKQMLALGRNWGSEWSGPAVDDPAAYRLPAARTDFVYCLVGERWGVPGTLGILGGFAVFLLTGLRSAARTRDPFGRLVATGIVTIIGTQVAINTAMTVGLAPITGLTLPLLSYGGSSLVATMFAIGLLLNIASDPGFDVAGQPFQFSR